MTPITDPAVITQLSTAINSNDYGSEKIDRIISAASVPAPGYAGDDTIVIAQSGIKQLVFLMNDTRPKGETFQSRILNPDDLGDDANFAEYPLDDRDDLDIITDRLREENLTEPWLAALMDKLKQSGDLSQFSDSLEEMYSELDSDAFRSAMLEAVSVSSLAGYSESPNA